MEISGKVVVVTGASDGIGRQIALKLAGQKAALALIARNQGRLEETQKQAIELGSPDARIYSCDIKDTEKLTATVNQIAADFSKVDILINVAGIWHKRGPVEELSVEMVDDVIRTNLTAAIQLTRLMIPILKKQPEAAIINLVSKSGLVAQAGQSVYSASKYGLRGFTEVLVEDLKGTNIKVAGVYPGGIHTHLFEKAGEVGVPAETFTEPADLADVVVFMLTRPPKLWLPHVKVSR